MSEEFNLSVSDLRRRQTNGHSHSNEYHEERRSTDAGRQYRGTGDRGPAAGTPFEPQAFRPTSAFNLWRLLEVLFRHWKWLIIGAGVAGMFAFLVGMRITNYTAKVTLIRQENPNAFTFGGGENAAPQAYLSRELSAQTLWAMMRSPEVFHRVALRANPPVRPEQLARAVKVVPERNQDFVTLAVAGKYPKDWLAKWANVYADEVVRFTREIQAEDARMISDFLKGKVKSVELQLAQVNTQMVHFAEQAQVLDVDKEVDSYTAQVTGLETKYETAQLELETLDIQQTNLVRELAGQGVNIGGGNTALNMAKEKLTELYSEGFTTNHPSVQKQLRIINMLAHDPAAASASVSGTGQMPVGAVANALTIELINLKSRRQVLEHTLKEYDELKKRMAAKAKSLSHSAVSYGELKGRQRRLEDLHTTYASKQQEAELLSQNALGYFKVYSYASPTDVSARTRFFTVALLAIVGGMMGLLASAGLALIAEVVDSRIKTVGDVERVTGLPVLATLGDLRQMTPEEQINWAFRTLTILQGKLNESSDETLVCGFISSRHGEGRSTWVDLLVSAASQRGMRVLTVATKPSKAAEEDGFQAAPKEPTLLPMGPSTTLTKNVLAYPAQVMEQFNDPQAQPIVHIPLPGWVWNLERRQQWRTALEHWQEIRNLVLFIELPPACQPESVLLAENLPQVIWLTGSGMANAEETRAQLDTLRHARCRLVGAVLNREPNSVLRKHFVRWVRRFSLLAVGSWLAANTAVAAVAPNQPTAAPAFENTSFSASATHKRAPWQERLTLGPGDTFDVSVFGYNQLTRTNVMVGPDGTISFLQIHDLPASGLTVDELRSRLDAALDPIYPAARTIVVPTAFNSKKYIILGKVVTEGIFTLDRPLSIIEAVARAKGLQTSTFERSTAEVADLSRSFLVRNGKRLPVDFERLFHEGDLSQNIDIEPGDYLYFAAASAPEIFVLGEVLTPGIVPVTGDASVLAAISVRGGFTPRAYRQRVLIIRGSLQHPDAFAVDTPAILAGRTPDFKLQPKDIVYVAARPWIRVEELLDSAAQSFIESAVTVWAGAYVPAVFTSPVIPHP